MIDSDAKLVISNNCIDDGISFLAVIEIYHHNCCG